MNTPVILAKNLAQLRKKAPLLADSVDDADLAQVVTGRGPRGMPTITDSGVLLNSAYDPHKEGERLAAKMNQNDPDLMVALGFGLGHHLEAFRRENSCPLVIFEPSRARLRAVLSIRADLEILSKSDVFVVNELSELQNIISTLYTTGLRIGVFPLPSLFRLCPDAVREAVDRISQAKSAEDIGVSTRVQMMARWASITAGNGAGLRDTPTIARLAGAFQGCTAVIACAGPSLTQQLPRLAKIRDRVLVIAIGQSVGTLRAAGIEPDFAHILESIPVLHQLEKGGSPRTINLVVSPDVDRSLFECETASRFVSIPGSNQLARWLVGALGDAQYQMGGGSVAHGAVAIAATLGAKQIVLIGQDLAFTNGQAYASGSVYEETGIEKSPDGTFRWRNIESKFALFEGANCPKENPDQKLLWVDGWNENEKVPTSRSYASFIDQYIGMSIEFERNGIDLINCTEGGARIPGIRHARFEEIDVDPGERVDARKVIAGFLETWSSPDPDAFDEVIRSAHETLDALVKDVRRGTREAERCYKIVERPISQQQELDILQRVRKLHRKVHRVIEKMPWLDDLIQPELQAVAPLLYRSRGTPSTARDALQVSILQFKSVKAGIERARPLLDRLTASLSKQAHENSVMDD